MSRTRPEQNYSSKTDSETRRENQDFEHQNNSTSRPPLDSTTLGTNTTNRTMSPIDLITVGTKKAEPTQRTRPTDYPTLPTNSWKWKEKAHVPVDPESDSSSSDSSSGKSDLSDDKSSSKPKNKKLNKRKIVGNTRNTTRQTHCRSILIRLTTVTTDASNTKRKSTGKITLSNYA